MDQLGWRAVDPGRDHEAAHPVAERSGDNYGPWPPLPRGKFTKYTYLSTNCSTNRPASLIILAFSMPYTLIWPLLIFDSRSATELIGNDVRPGRSGRWAMDPGCSGFLDFFHGGGGQCTWITLKQTVRIVLNWEVLRG